MAKGMEGPLLRGELDGKAAQERTSERSQRRKMELFFFFIFRSTKKTSGKKKHVCQSLYAPSSLLLFECCCCSSEEEDIAGHRTEFQGVDFDHARRRREREQHWRGRRRERRPAIDGLVDVGVVVVGRASSLWTSPTSSDSAAAGVPTPGANAST